jgi:hypothetical protein
MISFHIENIEITIHELTGGNTDRLDDLSELFTELFPQYAHRVFRMHRKAQDPPDVNPLFVEHQWLIDADGQPAAMTSFKYIPKRNIGLEIYLGVRPAFRKLGKSDHPRRMAEILIYTACEQLRSDARAAGRPSPAGLVFEVLEPKLVRQYREYGFLELPVAYYEPRYRPGHENFLAGGEDIDCKQAQLGIFPLNPEQTNKDDPALLSNIVSALLLDHYGLPENHWIIQCAFKSLKRRC